MRSNIYAACFPLMVCICSTVTAQDYNLVVTAGSGEDQERVECYAQATLASLRKDWGDEAIPILAYPVTIEISRSNDKAWGVSTYYPGLKNLKIEVGGDFEGILSNALPRQLSHLVLAERIEKAPRWAEMGIGLLSESRNSRDRHWKVFREARDGGMLMPFNELLTYTEYPKDVSDVIKMYSQSMVVAQYVAETWDRETLIRFVSDSKRIDLSSAIKKHLGFNSVGEFELGFRNWAADKRKGEPRVEPEPATTVFRPSKR
ncbi:hypothetical protein Q31b_36350 [Novipirellula aureliae]|uniref:Peptidase MA-like domain-containing protein n=1 Tax=Novipirellula aureliae TaxID=2527966 RepID=A0A5C6DU88_9BACT|nr:hypothetical protein [Novipirellula aureliae]TWU40288.1 hypothetical protein Q31b_36350 [Novipirellula aureliae]